MQLPRTGTHTLPSCNGNVHTLWKYFSRGPKFWLVMPPCDHFGFEKCINFNGLEISSGNQLFCFVAGQR